MNIIIKVKNSDYYPKSLMIKWLLATRRLLIRFVIALVVVPFLFWQDSQPNKGKYTHIFTLAALVLLLIYTAALLRSWFKYNSLGKKWLRLNREANADIELDITDAGIAFHDYRGVTENKWDEFTRFQSFRGYFFVMKKSPGDGITFDEGLVSKDQLDELQNFLTRYFYSQRNP